jgi:hypothetical protein
MLCRQSTGWTNQPQRKPMTWRHAHTPGCQRDLAGYPDSNWKLDPNCRRCQALALMLDRVAEISYRPAEVA